MSEVICPHCKNPIYDADALLCHFCGNSLNRASSGGLIGRMRVGGMKWVWITAAVLVLLALALSM
jgi:hypothetical protein